MAMIAFRHHFLTVLAALAGAACSASGGPEAGVAPQTEARGLARVTVVFGDSDDAHGVRVEGRLSLLRSREIDAEAADILAGIALRGALEPGFCTLVEPEQALDHALATTPERALVEHLDAGEVLIHVGEVAAGTILPRHLPALFPYVTGVQYEELQLSEGLYAQGLSDGAEISVTAFGGDDVGPFNVISHAPPHFAGVELERSEGFSLVWEAPAGSGKPRSGGGLSDAGERLEVVVESERGGAELRCLVEDSGRFTVPDELLRALSGVGAVAIERSRRFPFSAAGLQRGELEVVVRHVVTGVPG